MRVTECFNEGWVFVKQALSLEEAARAAGESVNLPHTWNALDGQDGGNDYYRGLCWYVKKFARPAGERVFLRFNGVNSTAEVFVNGAKAARHDGGYSAFYADITPYLKEENVICVSADNGANARVYPQFADFTFYGGIYRDVALIRCGESHFDMDEFGGGGIAVTPRVEGKNAFVRVQTRVKGVGEGQSVCVRILDAEGRAVCEKTQAASELLFELSIENVHLWDGVDDPYLYAAEARLLDGGRELDIVEARFGARTFFIDPERGFFLNGRSYPLRGVSRHQDRLGVGNALLREHHEEDMRLIHEMGANYIRLAHYQHDPYFYELCDRFGMVVWAEIPFISKFLPEANGNAVRQMNELIAQNYNHPSVVCWGLSNEITMEGVGEELLEIHRELNDLCHRLDPTRLTAMANLSMLPVDSPMNDIPDVFSYNHYFGWYGGSVEDNGPWLDNCRKELPNKALGLSEYGCEAVLKWHSSAPRCGDYTEEYQAIYHEKMLETFAERPYLWSTAVWNMFDFGSDMRDEGGEAGQNHKGLVTFDRKIKKDSYFIYKAWLCKEKFVHICGRRYEQRPEAVTEVKVYSNCGRMALFVNGAPAGETDGNKVFLFQAPLAMGENTITARAEGIADEIRLWRAEKPNPDYELPFGDAEVANWFDPSGNKVVFDFPEGYFSVRDSIRDIMANPQGAALMHDAMKAMLSGFDGLGIRLPPGMMKLMENSSIERLYSLAGLAGKKIPKEALLQLNRALNRIKK